MRCKNSCHRRLKGVPAGSLSLALPGSLIGVRPPTKDACGSLAKVVMDITVELMPKSGGMITYENRSKSSTKKRRHVESYGSSKFAGGGACRG